MNLVDLSARFFLELLFIAELAIHPRWLIVLADAAAS